MGNEKKILSDVERIDKNRRIAEAYYAAYNKQAVKDGAVYDEWMPYRITVRRRFCIMCGRI